MSREDRGRGTRADREAVARDRRDSGQPGVSETREGLFFGGSGRSTISNAAEFKGEKLTHGH